ncbi:MAG: FG-GAP repeat domain-containing protein [Planctomycetota bacterium]
MRMRTQQGFWLGSLALAALGLFGFPGAAVRGAELQAGFPVELAPPDQLESSGPINIMDLDNDGTLEILQHGLNGTMWVHNHDGTPYTGFSLVSTPQTYVDGLTQIFMGDLEGDGLPDVVFQGVPTTVLPSTHGVRHTALNADGSIKPGWPIVPDSGGTTNFYRLADLDGNGSHEVVIFSSVSRRQVFAYYGNGQPVPGWPVTIPWDTLPFPNNPILYYGGFAVGDVDLDGAAEVLVAVAPYTGGNMDPNQAVVINGDGTIREGWPRIIGPTSSHQHHPVVVDLDGRGQAEIVFFGGIGGVAIFDSSGSLVHELGGQTSWPVVPVSGITYDGNAVGDLEGDGMVEIVATNYNQLLRIKPVGPLPPMQPDVLQTNLPGYSEWRGISIADFDGDGPAEIAVWSINYNGVEEAVLHLLDLNLNERPGFPIHFGTPIVYAGGLQYVTIPADLDGDGDLELVHAYATHLYAWDIPRTGPGPVRIEWGNYHNDAAGSNDYHSRAPVVRKFIRGDAAVSGQLDLADVVTVAQHLFLSTPHGCPAQLDFDGDDHLNIDDVFGLVQYLFLAGPPPANNFPNCAPIPIDTDLACEGDHCP